MMSEDIKNFAKQFEYEPEIENEEGLGKFSRFVVVGMGGSNHPTGLLKIWKPDLDIIVHRNYGLPAVPEKDLKSSLIILSSYSGNTEEVIDAFHESGKRGLVRAVVSTGGRLLDLAKKEKTPFIKIPENKIQPRLALGLIFKALLKAMGQEEALRRASAELLPARGGVHRRARRRGRHRAASVGRHIDVEHDCHRDGLGGPAHDAAVHDRGAGAAGRRHVGGGRPVAPVAAPPLPARHENRSS